MEDLIRDPPAVGAVPADGNGWTWQGTVQLLTGSSEPDGEEGLGQESKGMLCWGGTSIGRACWSWRMLLVGVLQAREGRGVCAVD